MFIKPLLLVYQARNWQAVPCVIISSRVESHYSRSGTSDSKSYSVDVLYEYEFQGGKYRSNRYHFAAGSTSGYKRKAEVVRRYPPGKQTICYVNPQDPTQAVLMRGITATFAFGLIPLVFVVVGAVGIIFARRSAKRARQPLSYQGSDAPSLDQKLKSSRQLNESVSVTARLKPRASPWVKFLISILIAAFWNGIVSIFLLDVVQMWSKGQSGLFKWFPTLVLLPFVAVGLVMIGAVGFFFLALFNPRPRLMISPSRVAPGGSFQVQWELSGRVENIREMQLVLEGREEATYQRGTRTTTDKATFATIEIARLTHPMEMRSGTASVKVPPESMHSFSAAHNKIIWAIRLKGDIPHRPDLDEEYPVTVSP